MIQSFSDKDTEYFFITGKLKKNVGWQSISNIAKRKLDMIYYAEKLSDLKSPPANRLEHLIGDKKGWYSIRINNQWRIIFRWDNNDPEDIAIVDYH
jgi:proteic killer suppression protein